MLLLREKFCFSKSSSFPCICKGEEKEEEDLVNYLRSNWSVPRPIELRREKKRGEFASVVSHYREHCRYAFLINSLLSHCIPTRPTEFKIERHSTARTNEPIQKRATFRCDSSRWMLLLGTLQYGFTPLPFFLISHWTIANRHSLRLIRLHSTPWFDILCIVWAVWAYSFLFGPRWTTSRGGGESDRNGDGCPLSLSFLFLSSPEFD